MASGQEFQAQNRTDQGGNKKDPPEVDRLFKKENPDQNGSYCTDPSPNGICCTHWQGLSRFV